MNENKEANTVGQKLPSKGLFDEMRSLLQRERLEQGAFPNRKYMLCISFRFAGPSVALANLNISMFMKYLG
jgi:hypothetical protein